MKELNIIRKVVWSYVKSNRNLEYDELYSEACLAYLVASPQYDPAKSQKSTFVWRVVSNHLNNYIKDLRKKEFTETSLTELQSIEKEELNPEYIMSAREEWEELIAKMSPEAQMIYSIVNHEEFQEAQPKKIRGEIVKKLRRKGWSHGVIWSTFKEIKGALC